MRNFRTIWLAFLVVTAACDTPLGISGDQLPLLQTDAPSLMVTGGAFTIRYTLTNRGDDAIYFRTQSCSVGLERREGSDWAHAWEQTECLAALQVPIRLAPGEVHSDSLVVYYPEYATAGQHRVLMHALSDRLHSDGADVGPNLPREYRVSNGFLIEVP